MRPSQINALKFLYRLQLRRSLSRLSTRTKLRKSWKIQNVVLSHRRFLSSGNLLIYMAMPGEVQTKRIIAAALRLRKKVFLPAIEKTKKKISVFQIKNLKTDLRKGAFSILEPVKKRKGRPADLDLIIVPGLGFDRQGGRLGRGEGYYDRFLRKAPKAKKIGIAFREQILKQIPRLKHDLKMDQVITD